MTLNIKNPEAHRLATEIAKLTNTTLTEAVTNALREKLDRVTKPKFDQKRYEAIMRIANDCASRLSPETKTIDHGEYLYDEMGLPK